MASRELNILVAAKGALKAARDIGSVDKATSRLQGTAGRLGKAAAVGIGAGIAIGAAVIGRGVKSGLENLALLENATTQVQGAIDQMGIAGQVNAQQVAGWANSIESDIGAAFDDKDITSATATLIRFGKVTPQNLKPAMVVMTDLAAKTGSVDSAAALLAKALVDPAKAAGKLSKAGVVLTKTQQDQIKALVKAGKTVEAQTFLLGELAKVTKGAAEATVGPYQRSLNVLQDVTEDAQKALAVGFLPVIEKVRDILTRELGKPGTLKGIEDFGRGLAGGLEKLIDVAMGLPWDQIKTTFQVIGTGSKAMLDAFMGLPPWVQTAVLTAWGTNKITGGLVTSLASGLIKGVLGMTAGVVNINAGVVTGAGGVPGVAGAGAAGAGVAVTGAMAAGAIGAAVAATVLSTQDLLSRTTLEERRANGGLRAQQYQGSTATTAGAASTRRLNPGEIMANRAMSAAGFADQRRGERGGAVHSAIETETAAIRRFEASAAPSLASMRTHLGSLESLQRSAGSRDTTNAAQIAGAIAALTLAINNLKMPPVTVNVTAADNAKRDVARHRTVAPHGSRNSVVSGPGASGV